LWINAVYFAIVTSSITRKLLIEEAQKRGWKTESLSDEFFLKITDNHGQSELIRGTRTNRSSANGCLITQHKQVTMAFLEDIGYEVIPYLTPDSFDEALSFMLEHRVIVVKPTDASQSAGVEVNVRDAAHLQKALGTARANSPTSTVLLQPYLKGNLYRLMVLNGKFIGAVQRKAAEVIGDGKHTIQWLIDEANKDPRRGIDSSSVLKKIYLSGAISYLGREGIKTIPEAGKAVRVNYIDSVSAGGEAINVSDTVHSTWQQAAIDITTKAGLFICGFDVMCDDIAKPMETPVPILELNSMPGLKLLHFPTGGGEPINAASLLLDELFTL